MNLRSIRTRLTIWYSVAFFVTAAVVFSVFYFIARDTLLSQTDTTITSHAKAITSIIGSQQSDMMTGAFSQGVISQQYTDMPGMLVVIADPTGKIVSNSQKENSPNPIVTDLLEKSSGLIKPTFVDRTIGTSPLRIGVFPITRNNSLLGLVLVGHPVEVIQKALSSLLLLLIVVYVLFAIPVLVGGHLLARSAMDPIVKMSAKLKKISGENLDEQLENPKTRDEVEELSLTFNGLLQRLKASFQRERQFIGDVTHELKTPISIIQSSVEVALSKDRSKEEYQRVLSETLIDTARLSSTLTNVLDLAWSEADQSKQLTDPVNFSELVEETNDMAQKLAQAKQIKVEGNIEKGLVVFGKRDKLFRAVLNVIDNAIKYTPKKGQVTIYLKEKDDKADLEVIDTGHGIAKEEQSRVFERFYRGAKTDKTLGSGLGLAIAQAIITAHGGTIALSSEVGKGTQIKILIPLKTS